MQIYRVGGSVRDELLGLNWHDADWVVVGGTPQRMLDQGYLPVGKDFPVFLHPETREEYALARTERKTAPGYTGFDVHFAPDVTLEEDLLRRDLTINAMAIDTNGQLIDPYGGQVDLQARLLRHVSNAFAEDPVRILRVARFAARFGEFSVAAETNQLMQQMVADGEVNALVPERVWVELARGLLEAHPYRMIQVLDDCHALPILLPGLAPGEPLEHSLQRAAPYNDLPTRFALLALAAADNTGATHDTSAAQAHVQQLSRSVRLPNDCRDVAVLACAHGERVVRAAGSDAAALLRLVSDLDGLRRAARAEQVMNALRAHHGDVADSGITRVAAAMGAAGEVDAGAIARPLASQGAATIGEAIAAAREAAIAAMLTGNTRN